MPTERQNSLDYNIFFKTSSSIIAFNKSYRDNSFKVIILSQEPWVFIGRLFKVRFSVTINEQKSKQAKMGGGLERSEKGCVRGQGESPCFPLDSPSPPPSLVISLGCFYIQSLIIPTLSSFSLFSFSYKGGEHISCYTFNTHQAKHYFCSSCGIHPFYQPRTNPEARGISLQCLGEEETKKKAEVVPCDATNWEKWEQYLNEHPKARNLTENVE